MELKDILNVDDELNIYLVANGLKPASMITVNSINPKLDDKVTQEERTQDEVKHVDFRLNPDVVDTLKLLLEEQGIFYKDWAEENISPFFKGSKKFMEHTYHGHMFNIGSTQENLDRLLGAETNEERGIALGFPKEAIDAYKKIIDGERRDGTYVHVSLAKAKQAGLELPTWLAYICFIPENLDLVNGNVSESSKALAESYQKFVRENNPELAERVEKHFLERKLPDKWYKDRDGGYSCFFEPLAKD